MSKQQYIPILRRNIQSYDVLMELYRHQLDRNLDLEDFAEKELECLRQINQHIILPVNIMSQKF